MPTHEHKSTPSKKAKETTTMPTTTDTARAILIDDFSQDASWRHLKAADYPEDFRNAQAAFALEEMAAYVAGLPADDRRLLAVAKATPDWCAEFRFLSSTVNRIGFGGPPVDPSRELDLAVKSGLWDLETQDIDDSDDALDRAKARIRALLDAEDDDPPSGNTMP